MLPIHESDWKLLREKLPGWQENYMERLNQSYIALLSGPGDAADRFWALEKRIRKDKQKTGVIADMRRSNMLNIMVGLLVDKVITRKDLDGFSEDLQDQLSFLMGYDR